MQRLVRTESNYCTNQAELRGYAAAGIEKYEYSALEDNRTSDICKALDGKVFDIKDAVVGVNYPPMHPFCRSSTVPVIQTAEDIQSEIDERIESWHIPEGMSLDEFVERVNNGELEQIREEQNGETVSESDAISDFERKIYTSDTEHGLVVYPDGATKEFGGDEHTVMGDKSELSKMEGATFTHNHPSGVTFSTTDIGNGIVTGNLSELRAVTPSGEVHILHNNGASIEDRRKFNALYSENQKKAINIANSKISRGEVFDKEAFVSERKEKWLTENAEKYGLSYEKTNIDLSEDNVNTNYAKSIGALNFYEVSDDSPITAQNVIDDLQTSPIGQRVYNMLDELPEGIKCTEGKAPAGVRGEHSGNSIIIHVDNCSSNTEVACTIIHECTHHFMAIGDSQWAEAVCIAQEQKHILQRDHLTISEKRAIIKAVKADSDYSNYNWKRGGIEHGRRRNTKTS